MKRCENKKENVKTKKNSEKESGGGGY